MSELRVLCRLAAPDRSEERPEPTRLSEADWDRLLELAESHGLLHHLGEGLAGVDGVPDRVRSTIRDRRRRRAGASLGLTGAIHSVHDALRAASIRALPYKGPVLSAVAYGDVGARQYVDVDLLVAPGAFDRAREVLAAEGYRPVERLRGLGEVAMESDDGVLVDLHRSILPRYFPATMAFGDLWERSTTATVGGRDLPALDPADRLVVLSAHGTKHCWYRLAWLRDVAALIADDHVTWDRLEPRARRYRCRRHVLVAAWLAGRRFGVTPPPAVARAIEADPGAVALGEWIDRRIRTGGAQPPTDREQFRAGWRAFERRTDRLRFGTWLATLPSEDDVRSVALPDALVGLYRVIRPARLVGRYFRSAIGQGSEEPGRGNP